MRCQLQKTVSERFQQPAACLVSLYPFFLSIGLICCFQLPCLFVAEALAGLYLLAQVCDSSHDRRSQMKSEY